MSTIQRPASADGPHPVDDQLRAVLDAMPTLVWLAAPDWRSGVHQSSDGLEYTGLSADQAGRLEVGRLPFIKTTSTV